MKPFNLEEAKAGKQVVALGGYPARIICFDRIADRYPIIALLTIKDEEVPITYTNNGSLYGEPNDHHYDLRMVSEKKEGWSNIYPPYTVGNRKVIGEIFPTKEGAEHSRLVDCIATIKIEWEE